MFLSLVCSPMEEPLRCPGMHDLLPEEMDRFRQVEEVFRLTCREWGYQEVRTPTIEHLFLFTAAGTLSAQMLGRVYSFLDWDGWSGERVVLRPDSTIPVARLYIEHMMGAPLAKLFYVQNVFRFTEGEREEWQCGVELLGDTQPLGDVELVLLGREVLARLGLGALGVRLSHPGLVRAVLERTGLSAGEQLRLYDAILDGEQEALAQLRGRIPDLGPAVDLLLREEGQGANYVRNLRAAFAQALPEVARPLDELEALAETLEALGLVPTVTGAMVRNFEYYTGPVFQLLVGDVVVGGGGRYDALVEVLCGRQVPASGFALYMGRLLPLVTRPPVAAATVWVEPADGAATTVAAAFQAASALRERGLPAQVALARGVSWGGPRLLVGPQGMVAFGAGASAGQQVGSVDEALTVLSGGAEK